MQSHNQEQPLITIAIPSYNHGRFLSQTLDSVFAQNYQNSELLVVDNNSTDNTDSVLEQFKDSRMTVFKIQNNGSIAASRNLAIAAANGEWIAFLDSDDWWTEDKLSQSSKYFAQN